MLRIRTYTLIAACVLLAAAASAQSRGQGRLAGKVVDDQGKAAQDVQVRAQKVGQTDVLPAKTNNKGEWAIMGLAGGQWTLQFEKEGFEPAQINVEVNETERTPPINLKLVKAAPKVDIAAEVQAEGQKAAALMKEKQFAEARKIYEDLLAKYPQALEQTIHPFIARTYVAENNLDKAVEHLKIALEKDPNNVQTKMLLGDVLMEKGEKAEGQAILDSIDMTQVKDPYPFMNAAIALINEGKGDQAVELMNKVIANFPNQADAYYYRGRAYLSTKKMAEAKADLEKFVATAPPDARELENARKILEQMKDK
jgi:tetratricopeptide (TPR) repeat protein